MNVIYNALLTLADGLLPVTGLISPKMKLFVNGRKQVFETLSTIQPTDQVAWFHAASLGEFEQGVPVIEAYKQANPAHKILVSFYSPSGYEVRKNTPLADWVVYLPLDRPKYVRRFLDMAHPEMAFFIKYEFWPNFLAEMKNRKIRTFLISGIFRENQAFFKPYGGFYRRALDAFEHFFLQNETSLGLIRKLGKTNSTLSGDTRFDRVAAIAERNNELPQIAEFKGNNLLVVIGSSWPKDEILWTQYINQAPKNVKFIFAPHNIKPDQIAQLKANLTVPTVLHSELKTDQWTTAQVLIIDAVGFLTKVYSYADMAYVGGGFGHPGVHNLLEPAVFGIPIVIGPNYSHFAEAIDLVNLNAALSISNYEQLHSTLNKLINEPDFARKTGDLASEFVQQSKGATARIMNYLSSNHG